MAEAFRNSCRSLSAIFVETRTTENFYRVDRLSRLDGSIYFINISPCIDTNTKRVPSIYIETHNSANLRRNPPQGQQPSHRASVPLIPATRRNGDNCDKLIVDRQRHVDTSTI